MAMMTGATAHVIRAASSVRSGTKKRAKSGQLEGAPAEALCTVGWWLRDCVRWQREGWIKAKIYCCS